MQTKTQQVMRKWTKWGMLSLLLFGVAGISAAAPARPRHNAQNVPRTVVDPLSGTDWELTSPRYMGGDKAPFLKLKDGRLSASVGLNSIGGAYTIKGRRISFKHMISTMMAGPEPLMRAERSYMQALDGVTQYELSPDRQVLTLRGSQELIFHIASANMAQQIANTDWKLVSPEISGAKETPTLKFDKDSLIASVGLNTIRTSYTTKDERFYTSYMVSTKMAGPESLMKAESEYIKLLNGARSYRISEDGNDMMLYGKQDLHFQRISGSQ